MTPKKKYSWSWRHQGTFNKHSVKCLIIFQKHHFGKSQKLGNHMFWRCWKRRAPENPHDPANKFLKLLNMGSISIKKTWNRILLIRNRYLARKTLNNFGSLKLWDFETLERWNFETTNPRNKLTKSKQPTKTPKTQETKKPRMLVLPSKGIPTTPSAPLLGTRGNLGGKGGIWQRLNRWTGANPTNPTQKKRTAELCK